VLGVFGLGGYVRDTVNQGYLEEWSRLGAKNVRLPDERTGTFMGSRPLIRSLRIKTETSFAADLKNP